MSGHSKWHNIQGKKGKADKARSGLFTKFGRAITMAASQGGADPEMNFTLRLAVEKAKSINMPKDNIERAIKRGSGELNDGTTLEEALYEGFGPGGSTFLVEAVTDNKVRTVSEIKNIFSKHNSSMGGPGSVKWQYKNLGVLRFTKEEKAKLGDKWPEVELALIEAGLEDIEENEFGIELFCPIVNFKKMMDTVKVYNVVLEESGLEWVAKEKVNLSEDENKQAEELYNALDEMDDVKAVYTNVA